MRFGVTVKRAPLLITRFLYLVNGLLDEYGWLCMCNIILAILDRLRKFGQTTIITVIIVIMKHILNIFIGYAFHISLSCNFYLLPTMGEMLNNN